MRVKVAHLTNHDDEANLMMPRETTWFRVSIPIFLVAALLVGCASNSESTTPVQTVPPMTVEPAPASTLSVVERTPVTTPILTPVRTVPVTAVATADLCPYGVVYAYPGSEWTAADRPAIRERLEYLQGLGVNTIVQVFSSHPIGTGREKNWLIFLDEAEQVNMHVIARLWPPIEWDGQAFDFQAIQGFLAIVQDHPALLAYLGLHEPGEQFDSDQLREFYAGVKNLAPELAIAHYMGGIHPDRGFSAGICDVCIVWYYPARYIDGQAAFEEDLVYEALQTARMTIDERAPEAQLWFLGQAFASYKHRRELRMPTPDEMERLYTITQQERVDGFLWYPWRHGKYDWVLSDPEMEARRQAVQRIYEGHVVQEPAP